MNYLATYNNQIRRIKEEIWKDLIRYRINYSEKIEYSRYRYIYGHFVTKVSLDCIKIKIVEKSVISFTFNTQGVYFEKRNSQNNIWRKIFEGLNNGFANSQYLDIQKEFLTVTDDKSLKNFLDNIYTPKMLDSELGKKLMEIFKKTDMYKDICEDYKNFNKNYEEFTKNSSHEVELFRIKFLNTGRIQMLFNVRGKEKKRSYDDSEKLIWFGIRISYYITEIGECIKNECELLRKSLQ